MKGIVLLWHLMIAATAGRYGALAATMIGSTMIQTGFLELFHTADGSNDSIFRIFRVELVREFDPYDVALSVASIQAYDDPKQLYFGVQASSQNRTGFQAFVRISLTAQWKSLRVSYLVASSPFIEAGVFSVANPLLVKTIQQEDGLTVETKKIAKVINPLKSISEVQTNQLILRNYGTFIFIAGVKTTQKDINLRIVSSTFDSRQLQVEYEIIGATIPLELLSFTFIIYEYSRTQFIIFVSPTSMPRPVESETNKDKNFIGIYSISESAMKIKPSNTTEGFLQQFNTRQIYIVQDY